MKHKLPVLIVGTIAIIGLWIVFAWLPLSREMNTTHTRISAAVNEISDYNNTIAQLPSLLAAKAALDDRKRAQHSSLYAKEDMLQLFKKLESEAHSNNLSVSAITPPIEELLQLNRQVQNTSDPAFLNITMKLRGNYFSFTRFILELEQAPYFRGITACRVVDEDASPDRLQCLIGFRALLGQPEESL